jgi:integrase
MKARNVRGSGDPQPPAGLPPRAKAAVVTGARLGELIALDWTTSTSPATCSRSVITTTPSTARRCPRTARRERWALIPPAVKLFESWTALVGVRPGASPIFSALRGERLNGHYVSRRADSRDVRPNLLRARPGSAMGAVPARAQLARPHAERVRPLVGHRCARRGRARSHVPRLDLLSIRGGIRAHRRLPRANGEARPGRRTRVCWGPTG